MLRPTPVSTRTDTLVPYSTVFRSLGLAGAGERSPERGQYALFAFIEPYLRFAQGGVVHRAQLRHEFVEHLPSALHPFQKHGRVVGDDAALPVTGLKAHQPFLFQPAQGVVGGGAYDPRTRGEDRTSAVWGKRVHVRVDIGGRRIIK